MLLNAVMLATELLGAYRSRSAGILGDSIHILSHFVMAAISLYAVSRSFAWRNRAAYWKGLIMIALGCGSLIQTAIGHFQESIPEVETMGATSLIVLVCNLACLAILWPRKSDDLNMKSAWLCTLTDLLTDLGLLTASLLVWKTGSRLPDTLLGVACSGYAIWLSASLTRHAQLASRGIIIDRLTQFTQVTHPIRVRHSLRNNF